MAAKIKAIVGASRSGKTAQLLARYRQSLVASLHQGPADAGSTAGTLWIGPSAAAVNEVRERLLDSAAQAFLAPQIVTFARFAETVIAGGKQRIRPISRLQKRRILQRMVEIALAAGKLKHFTRVAKTPGFLAQVDETIAELKRQDLWPEDFEKHCHQPRERDLAAIYDLYQRHINANDLYDAEGRFWAARTELREQAPAERPQYRLLVVDGFSDFTAAQFDILQLLGDRADELLISLTLDPQCLESEHDAGRALCFLKPRQTLQRLRQLFPGLSIELSGPAQLGVPALAHLEQHLFLDPQKMAQLEPPTAGIEILAANGIQGEVEEIACRVKRLLLSGMARPQEIIVVFRGLGAVAGRIDEVFRDFGIPTSLGSWQILASSPLFRAIVSLLQLQAEDWPFRQLLSVAGNRLFQCFETAPAAGSRLATDPRIAVERCLREAQQPTGKDRLLERLRHWASADVAQLPAEEGSARDERIALLAADASLALGKLEALAVLLEELPPRATLVEWIEHLQKLLLGLGVPLEGQDETTSESQQLASPWKLLREGMTSLAKVEGWSSPAAAQLTIDELREALERIGAELQLPADHDSIGRVRVLGAEAARYVAAKFVFLAGLKEQAFAEADADNPLTGLRNLGLSGQSPDKLSGEDPHAGDELLLFYELVTRASEGLTLSYAALDSKGQKLSPSPLLVELEHCFGRSAVSRLEMSLGDSAKGKSAAVEPLGTSEFRRQAMLQALAGKPQWLAGIVSRAATTRLGESLLDGIGSIAARGEREQFGSYDGLLPGATAQAVLAQRFDAAHLWSPSQLEDYATCPFRFFSEQILKLEPPSELALRSDARRRGSLLHQVLARVHAHLGDESATTSENQSELVLRFQELLSQAVAAAPLEGLQHWLREIERREIEAWAGQYAQQETDYRKQWGKLDEPLRPMYLEIRFGSPARSGDSISDKSASTSLPFELDLGSEQIRLTGQIDRVDVGRVGETAVFNIIDYKSGTEVKLQIDQIRAGRQLQLPLYAMAAEKLLLAEQGALALSTGYWNVQSKGFIRRSGGPLAIRCLEGKTVKTSEQWDELQPAILQRIGQLVDGIRHGQFPVFNSDEHCTSYCSFSTICRVAHIRSLEKHWDPSTAE
ncbi:MAG: exodeoxyribonuclease V subunit gamma [Planctomycetales bacterium]|nr:exodeoxyribonuclease V subunit gamma [Planctomycetales bacterium]